MQALVITVYFSWHQYDGWSTLLLHA